MSWKKCWHLAVLTGISRGFKKQEGLFPKISLRRIVYSADGEVGGGSFVVNLHMPAAGIGLHTIR